MLRINYFVLSPTHFKYYTFNAHLEEKIVDVNIRSDDEDNGLSTYLCT